MLTQDTPRHHALMAAFQPRGSVPVFFILWTVLPARATPLGVSMQKNGQCQY
jgi:hypothetical protein